jgi:hypothetical protein
VEPRERIRKLLVLGDNRLKQGDARILVKARESYEEALALAREAGLEGQVSSGCLKSRTPDLEAALDADVIDLERRMVDAEALAEHALEL